MDVFLGLGRPLEFTDDSGDLFFLDRAACKAVKNDLVRLVARDDESVPGDGHELDRGRGEVYASPRFDVPDAYPRRSLHDEVFSVLTDEHLSHLDAAAVVFEDLARLVDQVGGPDLLVNGAFFRLAGDEVAAFFGSADRQPDSGLVFGVRLQAKFDFLGRRVEKNEFLAVGRGGQGLVGIEVEAQRISDEGSERNGGRFLPVGPEEFDEIRFLVVFAVLLDIGVDHRSVPGEAEFVFRLRGERPDEEALCGPEFQLLGLGERQIEFFVRAYRDACALGAHVSLLDHELRPARGGEAFGLHEIEPVIRLCGLKRLLVRIFQVDGALYVLELGSAGKEEQAEEQDQH